MAISYLESTGRVDLFSQSAFIGFDLPSAKIAGIFDGRIAVMGGAVPLSDPDLADAQFVGNVRLYNLSDYSVSSESAIYDEAGSNSALGAFDRVFQGAIWSDNGTFTINYLRSLDPAISGDLKHAAITGSSKLDDWDMDFSVPFEGISYSSRLFELTGSQKVMIQSYGGDWRGYLIDETGQATGDHIDFGNFYGKRSYPLADSGNDDQYFTWKLPQRDAESDQLFFQIMAIRFNDDGQPVNVPLALGEMVGDELQPVNIHTLSLSSGLTALIWQEIPNQGWVDRVLTKIQIIENDGTSHSQEIVLELQDKLPPGAASFSNQLSIVELDHGAFAILWHDKIAFFNKAGLQLGATQLLPENPDVRLNTMLDAISLPNGNIGVYASEFDSATSQQTFEEIKVSINFHSSNGDDWRVGTMKTDKIYGKGGNDLLEGFGGRDFLFGNRGYDTLFGQKGNDLLKGGAGKDTLMGNNGNDLLVGGKGSDILTGGHGNDVFMFKSGSIGHRDHITDFDSENDRIVIQGSSLEQLSITYFKSKTTIEYDGGVIVLDDISRTEFEPDSLEF